MIVPQKASATVPFQIPGGSLYFGREVPKGLLLRLDPGAQDPVEVTPGMIVHRKFSRFWLDFPGKVSEESLTVFVDRPILDPAGPNSRQVASGSGTLPSLGSVDIKLKPLGFLGGGIPYATHLVGAIQVTATTNLPTVVMLWDNEFGEVASIAKRFMAIAALSSAAPFIDFWPYPLGGGKLRIVNGATPRTLSYDLYSVRL